MSVGEDESRDWNTNEATNIGVGNQ